MSEPREFYRYAAPGERSEKTTLLHQVRYLPGLEMRTCSTGLRVMMVGHSRLYRAERQTFTHFNLCDRLGSITGVLDESGRLISQENGYPYGGTACWRTGSQAGAAIKFQRYAGKERDITGMIFYGWRCYVPWLMRWLNGDPAGTIDGLNLFRMVRNNPVSMSDPDGRMSKDDLMPAEMSLLPDSSTEMVVTLNTPAEQFEKEMKLLEALIELVNIPHPVTDATKKVPKVIIKLRFECNRCEQRFVSKRCLNRHIRETDCHLKYKCDVAGCTTSWNYKSHLARHLLAHNQEKTANCTIAGCNKTFKTNSQRNAHIRTVHEGIMFDCGNPTCQMVFSKKQNRDRHYTTCQNINVKDRLNCPHCKNWYFVPGMLTRHLRKYHPSTQPRR